LAKANNTPVPSMPAEFAANTTTLAASVKAPQVVAMSQAPLKAQKPNEQEVEIAEVFVAPNPAQQLPATLPTTGSSVPLIGLIGLLSLATALSLRFAAKKV
jgi:LPXTG-motif cell wall-anchored protein